MVNSIILLYILILCIILLLLEGHTGLVALKRLIELNVNVILLEKRIGNS